MIKYILFTFVLLITYTIEGLTGFGGGILAMPFLEPLVGLKTVVPTMALVGVFSSAYRTITMRRYIIKREWLIIIFFTILGMPIGMWAFSALPEALIKVLLGIFMLWVAIKGLVEIYHPHLKAQAVQTASGKRKWLFYFILFLGGIVQGAVTCGGPFVVVYATMAIKDPQSFRAVIFSTFLVTSSLLTVRNAVSGFLTSDVLYLTAWALVAMVISIFISNRLQKYIKGQMFHKLVYGTLLVAGIFMCINH